MMFKTIVAATALAMLPALGSAMCSGHSDQAQSCAPGTVWDAAQQSCVQKVNG